MDLKPQLSLHDSISDLFDLFEMILDLQLGGFHFVKIWLGHFTVVTDCSSQSIIQVVFQGVDPVRLILFKCFAISLNHLDQIIIRLELESFASLYLHYLIIEGLQDLDDFSYCLLYR